MRSARLYKPTKLLLDILFRKLVFRKRVCHFIQGPVLKMYSKALLICLKLIVSYNISTVEGIRGTWRVNNSSLIFHVISGTPTASLTAIQFGHHSAGSL